MYEYILLYAIAIAASVMREIYGHKGMFIFPHVTDKGLALGSVSSVIVAVFAVTVNFAMIPTVLTIPIALSLGLSWGIAAPDVVANLLGRVAKQ